MHIVAVRLALLDTWTFANYYPGSQLHRKGSGGSWWINRTWPSKVPLQQWRPGTSWAALAMFSPSHRWRKWSFPSISHSWNIVPSFGLPRPHRKSHEWLPSCLGAGAHAIWGEAGAVGSVRPGEEKVSGGSNCYLQLPNKGEDKAKLFPEVCRDRTRGNRHCLKCMKIWKFLIQEIFIWSAMILVRHWKKLPREAVGFLSLKVFKIKLDIALRDLIWIDLLWAEAGSRELLRSIPVYEVVRWPNSLTESLLPHVPHVQLHAISFSRENETNIWQK